jgi:hypothetical protein
VCLEALAEHAHDGGAILREVNPKAHTPLEACVESLAVYAHGGEWAPPKEMLLEALSKPPIDTTKSAPPLTPDERQVYDCPCGNAREWSPRRFTVKCSKCGELCTQIRVDHFVKAE